MFEELVDIWDTGDSTPFDLIDDADPKRYDEFKSRTGATRAVEVRWIHEGQIHVCPYPLLRLPDQSGLLVPVGLKPPYKRMVVIAPNGTARCSISVPRLDERSKPESGCLTLITEKKPQSSESWWGIGGFDGYRTALFRFDWQTGKLLDWEEKSGGWAMHNGVF